MTPYVSPVIPVLDLMIGQIVWARGGDRGRYSPVESSLTNSSNPVEVAKAMFSQTGCDCLYLADIDSFAGAIPSWETYQALTEAGFSLWIDADWISALKSEELAAKVIALGSQPKVDLIFSSETFTSVEQFSIIGELINKNVEPIFSLDVNGPRVITKSESLSSSGPLELVQKAFEQGVRTMIILDLQSIGTYQGSRMTDLIREISHELPDVTLISGGGISSVDDAQKLLNAGCQNVLVASAIYDCKITPDEIAHLEPFRVHAGTQAALTRTSRTR